MSPLSTRSAATGAVDAAVAESREKVAAGSPLPAAAGSELRRTLLLLLDRCGPNSARGGDEIIQMEVEGVRRWVEGRGRWRK